MRVLPVCVSEQLLDQFAESERLGSVVREQLASLDLEGGEL